MVVSYSWHLNSSFCNWISSLFSVALGLYLVFRWTFFTKSSLLIFHILLRYLVKNQTLLITISVSYWVLAFVSRFLDDVWYFTVAGSRLFLCHFCMRTILQSLKTRSSVKILLRNIKSAVIYDKVTLSLPVFLHMKSVYRQFSCTHNVTLNKKCQESATSFSCCAENKWLELPK